jgi:hypothetical protein
MGPPLLPSAGPAPPAPPAYLHVCPLEPHPAPGCAGCSSGARCVGGARCCGPGGGCPPGRPALSGPLLHLCAGAQRSGPAAAGAGGGAGCARANGRPGPHIRYDPARRHTPEVGGGRRRGRIPLAGPGALYVPLPRGMVAVPDKERAQAPSCFMTSAPYLHELTQRDVWAKIVSADTSSLGQPGAVCKLWCAGRQCLGGPSATMGGIRSTLSCMMHLGVENAHPPMSLLRLASVSVPWPPCHFVCHHLPQSTGIRDPVVTACCGACRCLWGGVGQPRVGSRLGGSRSGWRPGVPSPHSPPRPPPAHPAPPLQQWPTGSRQRARPRGERQHGQWPHSHRGAPQPGGPACGPAPLGLSHHHRGPPPDSPLGSNDEWGSSRRLDGWSGRKGRPEGYRPQERGGTVRARREECKPTAGTRRDVTKW